MTTPAPNPVRHVDVAVVGGGPGGHAAALEAARLGGRVALVERRRPDSLLGRPAVPSKTLRAAVLEALAARGDGPRRGAHVDLAALRARTRRVLHAESERTTAQLRAAGVELVDGWARFTDPHTLACHDEEHVDLLHADRIILAVGSHGVVPAGIGLDHRGAVLADALLDLDELPATATVVGGGLVGLEYASLLGALGAEVTVVEARDVLLPFVDVDLVAALRASLDRLHVTVRLSDPVEAVTASDSGLLTTRTRSGERLPSRAVIWAAGRHGSTETLELAAAGLVGAADGRLAVDEAFRTAVPHVFAVGDVVGSPCLAAHAADQGIQAARHAAGAPRQPRRSRLPVPIWSIPELAGVGRTEQQLQATSAPYVAGSGAYVDLVRAGIDRQEEGFVKLLVEPRTRMLLGAHLFGAGATELVHIGQAVLTLGGTVDALAESTYAYPTLAAGYALAAQDAQRALAAHAEAAQAAAGAALRG